jgi:hypothetical protein
MADKISEYVSGKSVPWILTQKQQDHLDCDKYFKYFEVSQSNETESIFTTYVRMTFESTECGKYVFII